MVNIADRHGGIMENRENKDSRDNAKKQIPLRLSTSLWQELNAWAEDDFRSLNGQIEYLLSECVKKRKGGSCRDAGGVA
jgi:hypothetical protein